MFINLTVNVNVSICLSVLLQMFVPSMFGVPLYPSTLADDRETPRCVALQTDTPKDLENYFRVNCVKMG